MVQTFTHQQRDSRLKAGQIVAFEVVQCDHNRGLAVVVVQRDVDVAGGDCDALSIDDSQVQRIGRRGKRNVQVSRSSRRVESRRRVRRTGYSTTPRRRAELACWGLVFAGRAALPTPSQGRMVQAHAVRLDAHVLQVRVDCACHRPDYTVGS
jgi:hypothetical protein